MIPFVVLPRVDVDFTDIIESGEFIGGPHVAAFEAEWAAYNGVGHCVSCGNGTDAIELALRGLGVTGRVVLPANTFVATVEATVRAGCVPVLADVDDETLLAKDCDVAVNLYGQMAGGTLVEDAAQSHGATFHGRRVTGLVSATSFYPGKNLGAFGDAGAVVTDDADLAGRMRAIANHGNRGDVFGFNSRLDAMQAKVLRAKLPHLDEWNAQRVEAARYYSELLRDDRVRLPPLTDGNAWHLYVVRIPDRDRVLAELNEHDIDARVHYPTPIHRLPGWPLPGSFPVAERAATEILSLPMWPGITERQQEQVAEALREALP